MAVAPAQRPPAVAPGRRPGRTARIVAGSIAALALLALLIWLAGLEGRGGALSPPPPAQIDPTVAGEGLVSCATALERAAIAVETFRAEQGVDPAGWDDLVPGLLDEPPHDPGDPSGGNLRLQVPSWDPDSLLLYSVGPDGRDDGGKALVSETGLGDVVYVVR